MAKNEVDTSNVSAKTHHKADWLSHALYGLIIVTATLVAEQLHITEADEAMGLLLGTALVLLLAHTYGAALAERTVGGHSLGSVGRGVVMRDNLPDLLAIIVPAQLSSSQVSASSRSRRHTRSQSPSPWWLSSGLACTRGEQRQCHGRSPC